MKISNFESPAYNVQRVDIDDLVSQRSNPNQMTGKSWDALQISILNSGYTFPVIAATSADYDPATNGLPKPELVEHKDDENKGGAVNGEGGMQVADEEISKYFKYRLIDGAHRTQIIRLGKWYFMHGHDNNEQWSQGVNIPEHAGPDMLAYLAWRENFSIPCVIREIDPVQQMSEEILHNTARGSHSLDGMKDIVYNLINVAGMSEEWVAKNLFLDLESIKRMQQLSGLKASMSDIDDCDMSWNPNEDDSYGRKVVSLMTREASKYIEIYRQEHANDKATMVDILKTGTAVEIAVSLGFDKTQVYQKNIEAYQASMSRMSKQEE